MKNNLFTPLIRRMAAISTVLILFAAWSAGCSKDDTGESGIQAGLLIYKNTVIGGDVLSAQLGGFIHGLKMPS